MMSFLKKYFGSLFSGTKAVQTDQPKTAPVSSVAPRVSGLESENWTSEHGEQLRRFGGVTMASSNSELQSDLLSWGYLSTGADGSKQLTKKGHEWVAKSGAWSPNKDPRTDR